MRDLQISTDGLTRTQQVETNAEEATMMDAQYDLCEGDTVTLPDGTKVEVEQIDHDEVGTFFTCTEDGEGVWYYESILDSHPDNASLRN